MSFLSKNEIVLKTFKPVLQELFRELDARALTAGVDTRTVNIETFQKIEDAWSDIWGIGRKLHDELSGMASLYNSTRIINGPFVPFSQEEIDSILLREILSPPSATWCAGIFDILKNFVVYRLANEEIDILRVTTGRDPVYEMDWIPRHGSTAIPRRTSGKSIVYIFSPVQCHATIYIYDSYRSPKTLLQWHSVEITEEYSPSDYAYDDFGGTAATKYRYEVGDLFSYYDSAYIDLVLDGTSQIIANGGTVPLPPIEQ